MGGLDGLFSNIRSISVTMLVFSLGISWEDKKYILEDFNTFKDHLYQPEGTVCFHKADPPS